MNESYAEASVKCNPKMSSYLIKGGAIVLSLIVATIGTPYVGSIAALIAIILVGACFYFVPSSGVEYEYIFCDGQLDFDRIIRNSKRKTIMRIDFEKVDMMAPSESHSLDNYKNMQLQTKDFTSNTKEAKTYTIIYHGEKQNYRILFEPSEKLIETVRKKTPRKVSMI